MLRHSTSLQRYDFLGVPTMQGRRSDAVLWYYTVPGMRMARPWALEDGSELRMCRVDVEYEPCVLTITRIDMCRC